MHDFILSAISSESNCPKRPMVLRQQRFLTLLTQQEELLMTQIQTLLNYVNRVMVPEHADTWIVQARHHHLGAFSF